MASNGFAHGREAAALLYWFRAEDKTWAKYDDQHECWVTWSFGGQRPPSPRKRRESGLVERPSQDPAPPDPKVSSLGDWSAWTSTFDDSDAPFFRWFAGGYTNSCFNLVDKHLLEGKGMEVAFTVCPEAEDAASESITRRELAIRVADAAARLTHECGLQPKDRVMFHMPTGIQQMVWLLAAQRCGIIYTATAVDHPVSALKYRITDFKPQLLVASLAPSSQGGRRIVCAESVKGLMPPEQILALPPQQPMSSLGMGEAYLSLADHELAARVWAICPAQPVPADHPLFVSYTSGSTGKPKGIVHVHGGYVYGIALTMREVFEAQGSQDTILTIGTTGWITGQSYMLVGPLVSGVRSVLLEGSPIYPSALRWAAVLAQQEVTIFKTGSALIRSIMTSPEAVAQLADTDFSSLRYATFCAEPVSQAVHEFAAKHITANFMNSYWATEHGGIVFTRPLQSSIKPDTKSYPLPWIAAAIAPGDPSDVTYGDILITEPYPYMGRTVFGDVERLQEDSWLGDAARYGHTYFPGATMSLGRDVFLQGDNARCHADGGYTFHGRSDEVINVSGNRVGTEEIEALLWSSAEPGALKGVAVVGGPDFDKGSTPVAFVVFDPATAANPADPGAFLRLAQAAAREWLGEHAVPENVLVCSALPMTSTGKVARATLQLLLAGKHADRSSLRNPEAMEELAALCGRWRAWEAKLETRVDSAAIWAACRFQDHTIMGQPLAPAAGWLTLLGQQWWAAHDGGAFRLTAVRFLRPMNEPLALEIVSGRTAVSVLHQGDSLVQATRTPPRSREGGGAELSPDEASALPGPPPLKEGMLALEAAGTDNVETLDGRQFYRRCHRLQLQYAESFVVMSLVQWRGFEFHGLLEAPHLPAVLDSALQVVCAFDPVATFIPFTVAEFALLRAPADFGADAGMRRFRCRVAGEILERSADTVHCNLVYYDDPPPAGVDSEQPFAFMRGVSLTKVADRVPRLQPTAVQPTATPATRGGSDAASLALLPPAERTAAVQATILELGGQVLGAEVDIGQSLFENGLHSLKAVRLLSALNDRLGIKLSSRLLAEATDISKLAGDIGAMLAPSAQGATGATPGAFPKVNMESLQRIVDARLAGRTAPASMAKTVSPFMAAVDGIYYTIRKGILTKVRSQIEEGVFEFLRNPPRKIDLEHRVSIPGLRVQFSQCDFNRHFTVREIIPASERALYLLLNRSGLCHLEHYFQKLAFASTLNAAFSKELVWGAEFEMRSRVKDVRGPILDVEVSFWDPEGDKCFEVTWSMMVVINVETKRLYDFEIGMPAKELESASPTPAPARKTFVPIALLGPLVLVWLAIRAIYFALL